MDHFLGTLRDKMIRETEHFLERHLNQDLRALTAGSLSMPATPPSRPDNAVRTLSGDHRIRDLGSDRSSACHRPQSDHPHGDAVVREWSGAAS